MDREALNAWIGREQVVTDCITDRLLVQFEAALGHYLYDAGTGEVPLGIQWCLGTPETNTENLSLDGHPPRGDFLPAISLPRRMWAGGKIICRKPMPAGKPIRLSSKITAIEWKEGKTGALCFVTVDHGYYDDEVLLISERQDIVYRDSSTAPAPPPPVAQAGEPLGADRLIKASTPLLFRYSALTFNSHRIHYDKYYAQLEEGYAGLVVQGPLQATLLLNHAARILGTARLEFTFRGVAPLIGEQTFGLCHEQRGETVHCWTQGSDGTTAMQAEAKRLAADE